MNNALLALLVVVVGLGLLWVGYSDYQTQEERLENAIEVEATVLETDVDRRSGSRGGSSYYPVVEFEYTYEGETYTSSNLDAADSRSAESSRSDAEAILEAYPEDETVTAYLDPAEPGTAFLEAEASPVPLAFAVIGALVAVCGLTAFGRARLLNAWADDG